MIKQKTNQEIDNEYQLGEIAMDEVHSGNLLIKKVKKLCRNNSDIISYYKSVIQYILNEIELLEEDNNSEEDLYSQEEIDEYIDNNLNQD